MWARLCQHKILYGSNMYSIYTQNYYDPIPFNEKRIWLKANSNSCKTLFCDVLWVSNDWQIRIQGHYFWEEYFGPTEEQALDRGHTYHYMRWPSGTLCIWKWYDAHTQCFMWTNIKHKKIKSLFNKSLRLISTNISHHLAHQIKRNLKYQASVSNGRWGKCDLIG